MVVGAVVGPSIDGRAAIGAQRGDEDRVVGAGKTGRADEVDLHAPGAGAAEVQRFGHALRNVEHAPGVERAAIVDAHDDRMSVAAGL